MAELILYCESEDCAYNNCGECRYAAVYERAPEITDEDGCKNFCLTG